MDGTVLDSLALDLAICNELLRKHLAADVHVSRAFIQDNFAFEPPKFWQRILEQVETDFGVKQGTAFQAILQEYEEARSSASFEPCPGAREVLEDARNRGIPLAIVSNNETEVVRNILRRSGMEHFFDVVVGNDYVDLKKKPAPDTYLLAAKMLEIDPTRAVVLEDSIIGVEAGRKAGSHVVGVATGGTSFDTLALCGSADVVYVDLEKSVQATKSDSPSRITTPLALVDRWSSAFLSSSPAAVELTWKNNDWEWLGSALFALLARAGASATVPALPAPSDVDVVFDPGTGRGLDFATAAGVNADDLTDRSSLPDRERDAAVRVLRGVAQAAHRDLRVIVREQVAVEDMWEAIFRAVGRAVHAA